MIENVERTARAVEANGDKTVVALTRTYDADIADVWEAVTDPERLSRWFLPLEGELKVGGTYELKGNAGGTILACEPPRRLLVTWVFPPGATENISEVEVLLSETGNGDKTVLELRHEATVDPAMWSQFGPGAVGVGWDLGLLGLGMHLQSGASRPPEDFEASPEARQYITACSEAWGVANANYGTAPDEVAAAVAATTAFYTPPQKPVDDAA
jgi:uncharacterized protein YndB with AHSA1/START domain